MERNVGKNDEEVPGTAGDAPSARDREMGRGGDEPLGDLGHGRETWKPPAGEQGISNRPDDSGTMTDKNPSPLSADEQAQDPADEDTQPLEYDDEGEGEQAERNQTRAIIGDIDSE
jgi:hypothetical protein